VSNAGQHPDDGQPRHLLWAYLFLRQYCTEEINHAFMKASEKTFRKWSRHYIELMALQLHVVRII
jgi:hypothetical protein